MDNNMTNENFFKKPASLSVNRFMVSKTEHITLMKAVDYIISNIAEKSTYQVIAHFVNAIKMGWIKDGKIIFYDGDGLDEEYLLQIRVFNANEEIMLKKSRKGYAARIIKDTPNDNDDSVKAVDSSSILFGERQQPVKDGFAILYEEGRKIKLVIPTEENDKKYKLTTRSYITYNNDPNNGGNVSTYQAGYGYWRYVGISAVKGAE